MGLLAGAGALAACGGKGVGVDSAAVDSADAGGEGGGEGGADSGALMDTADSGATGACATADEPVTSCAITPAQEEGPNYLTGVPERSSANVRGEAGFTLTLTGRVLDLACGPLVGVTVEIWHADQAGDYNLESEDLHGRASVETDETGLYCIETLRPPTLDDPELGQLPAHIHVKVWRDGSNLLTTQLFFEGDETLDDKPLPESATSLIRAVEALGADRGRIEMDLVVNPFGDGGGGGGEGG